MQKFNYHTHTYRCGHSDSSISDEEYVELFINKGFKKICFTDHCPQKNKIDLRTNMRMDYAEKEGYYNSIKSLKEKYKDKIDIEVGFEVEYAPGIENDLFVLKKETDKLILGQHFVYDETNKFLKIVGWGNTNDGDIVRYAEYVKKAIELGIPNVIAHPDLFMLNRNNFGEVEKKATRIICEVAEKHQIPLEINLTRACLYLKNRINKIEYPDKNFWEIASEYNVKVIYGVDAHFREQIKYYEESIELVKQHLGTGIINKLNFVDEDL